MSVTSIGFDDPVRDDDHVRWSGWMEADGQRRTVTTTFTCPDPDEFVPSVRPFLLAFLVPAMISGHPVQLAGPIDPGTAAGVAEWQEAMAVLHPGLRPIPITATRRSEARPPQRTGGITAFSGGIDSCFTAVRGRRGARARPHRDPELVAGLMVHGFDIDSTDATTFGAAFLRSRRILRSLGLEAYALRTDVRKLEDEFDCSWQNHLHGIWLAFALSCVEQWFTRTVVPATYPYDQLRPRWASNPMTDPLLGSATRPLWHDGAAFDQLDKVAALADVPAVVENLRVCRRADSLDRNCGGCFECVVAQACFWIAGVAEPPAFESAASVDDLAEVALTDPYKVRLGRRMLERAIGRDRPDLADALADALGAVGEEVRR